jgi:AraC-like DNA-binding protein
MPQTVDPLSGRLSPSYGHALRELFVHYEIEIISCVFWRNRAPWEVPTRKCFDSFFLFPVRGNVRVTLASGRPVIAPGDYLALPEGERHALALEKGHARLEQIALHCRVQDRWRRPLLSRFSSPVGRLEDPARWHRVLADLACLMSVDPELGQHRGKILVRELMADWLREEKNLSPLNRNGDPRIERVLQRMKDELTSPTLSIEALADEIDLTATQMRKLFRRETRRGPKQYLHRLRLEKASHLLRTSTQTIKQVALESGFATDNYFHLVFRKAFGLTPTAFRDKEILC